MVLSRRSFSHKPDQRIHSGFRISHRFVIIEPKTLKVLEQLEHDFACLTWAPLAGQQVIARGSGVTEVVLLPPMQPIRLVFRLAIQLVGRGLPEAFLSVSPNPRLGR
jgi:hypothetical protein